MGGAKALGSRHQRSWIEEGEEWREGSGESAAALLTLRERGERKEGKGESERETENGITSGDRYGVGTQQVH